LIEDGFELFILGSPTYESLTDGFAREYPDLAFLLLFSTGINTQLFPLSEYTV
tara:strand:+ start:233 stop:391 length:159 start_codon:yes stop_codon:yes gene_type:complete